MPSSDTTVTCGFTYAHYAEILSALNAAGYEAVSFRDCTAPSHVILRHDVDLSLEAAVRLAEIEAAAGVTSVFHFLLTSEVYNLASSEGRVVLRTLKSLGARVGLHLDPAAFDGEPTREGLQEWLRNQFQLGQRVIGDLDSYSLHRPAARDWGNVFVPRELSFPVPAFAADFYDGAGITYCSDSRREWRQGCICTRIAALAGRPLQLNIHPIWWSEVDITRREVLENYVRGERDIVEKYLARNLSFYAG